MKYTLEVRRTRSSVTQGSVTVLIDGKPIVSYCDQIKLVGSDDEYCGAKGRPTYGENIGGWASILPDSYFVIGMWCHEDTNDRIAEAMKGKERKHMDSIYIIVKNEHGNPKTPVRWGRQGGGAFGYCLNDGHVVCFESFEEADKVLATFTEPHWYDIVEYRKA